MAKRLCPSCNKRLTREHHNSKWCLPCANEKRRRPKGTLTATQRAFARKHRADMPREEIARRLGVSSSNLKRSCRDVRFCFQNGKYKNDPRLIKRVAEHYSDHGWEATAKSFPKVKIKSIIHRGDYYGFKLKPRQIRWKEEEIILAARMAGLVEGWQ